MKVGDFVRIREYIRKIRKIEQDYIYCDIGVFTENEIVKSSPRIIDLIECNDLIEIEYFSLRYKRRVTRLFEVTYKDKRYINLSNSKCDFVLVDNDFSDSDKELKPVIKSIVTHEQFENMAYRVEE